MQNLMLLILIVEDEFLVQDLVHEALSEGGFHTEITSSGEEAITLLEGDATKYRALLTDIHLKGELTGWDVARRARQITPEMPVVYMTGAGADQWQANGVPQSVLLTKPFAPAQVVNAISQLLNRAPPPHQ